MYFLHKIKKILFTPVKLSFIIAIILHIFLLTVFSEGVFLSVPDIPEEEITFKIVNKKDKDFNKPEPEPAVTKARTKKVVEEEVIKEEVKERAAKKENKIITEKKVKNGIKKINKVEAKTLEPEPHPEEKVEEKQGQKNNLAEKEKAVILPESDRQNTVNKNGESNIKKQEKNMKINSEIEIVEKGNIETVEKNEKKKDEETELKKNRRRKNKEEEVDIIEKTKSIKKENSDKEKDNKVLTSKVKDTELKETGKPNKDEIEREREDFNPLLRQMKAKNEYIKSESIKKADTGEVGEEKNAGEGKVKKNEQADSKKSSSANLSEQDKITDLEKKFSGEQNKGDKKDKNNDQNKEEIVDFTEGEYGEGINPPGVCKLEQPVYPEELREREIEGKVILKLLLNEKGEVEKIGIYESSGFKQFDSEAKKAAEKWIFTPAEKEGNEVKARLLIPIKFNLD